MTTAEIILVVILVTLEIVAFWVFVCPEIGKKILRFCETLSTCKNDTPERSQPFDPCGSCQRWGECNGVDRDNCPLWQDYDKQEENKQ